ncbi:MAG: deoxynucleoside kinase [Saprospiraceae bacterium]|nr:deoxynucleoside kinase [Saprospiraceae bacterium]
MPTAIPYQYICIEGNIGAGKTTFCELLAEDIACKLVLEEFADNPFLPNFYKEPKRFAFPMELFLMAERFKQLQNHIHHRDLFSDYIVSDYTFVKTLLFAKNNLPEEEYRLFHDMYQILSEQIPNPDILVYLHRPLEVLKQQIMLRGRPYEQSIDSGYLQGLQNMYFEYFRNEVQFPILMVDLGAANFINEPDAYQEIKNLMMDEWKPGLHRIGLK